MPAYSDADVRAALCLGAIAFAVFHIKKHPCGLGNSATQSGKA